MRAAKLTERPSFPLMRQSDIQHIYHMQMPRWLFSDPRYADMALEAKVVYTFLLNRFQLSRRNGWVNDHGEVFVIFPRKELAKELRICEKRVTAAFRQLAKLSLIWEKRCGRGDANQIYLASVEPQTDPAYTCAPFLDPEQESAADTRTANEESLEGQRRTTEVQEQPDWRVCNSQKGVSRTAEKALLEPPQLPPSYIERSNIDFSHTEVSQSVCSNARDGRTDDEEELTVILNGCELFSFDPETAMVFENAIERLYYSDSFRVGNATLPQNRVRSKLYLLDVMILREAERKLHANMTREISNSTAYVMSTIFNCIAESESDLMVDSYLNLISAPIGGG